MKYNLTIFFIGCFLILSANNIDKKTIIEAIKNNDTSILVSMFEQGIDVNMPFENGLSAIYYSIKYKKPNVCSYLLCQGADPNMVIKKRPLLYWAVKFGLKRITRFLIEYGADVNYIGKHSNSLLIHSVKMNQPVICKILIESGADLFYEDKNGKKVYDYAVKINRFPNLISYLEIMEKHLRKNIYTESMRDGPYVFWENDHQAVLTYYERVKEKNITHLFEKTFEIDSNVLKVKGILWDTNTYHIERSYNPQPSKIKMKGGIFVIGDVHGRMHALQKLLINNQIIDSKLNWTFGNGHLVFLGDVFDRGSMVTETLWFIHELQYKARKQGGNVHLLLGNHEIMTIDGNHNYLNDKYLYFSQFFSKYYKSFYNNNSEIGKWLRNLNSIIEINGNLFSHAGISPQMDSLKISIDSINNFVRSYLNSTIDSSNIGVLNNVLGLHGPFWYRGYRDFLEHTQEQLDFFVKTYLKDNGLKRMIIGHNEYAEIKPMFDNKLISIDVYINESGNSMQGLLINQEHLYICYSDGRKEAINPVNKEYP